jgi:2-amino-4-hydroxy-6-hydroxymethyldihydropteridine diphosphokinase
MAPESAESRTLDPAQTLTAALRFLRAEGVLPRRISRFFRTPCFPPGSGPDYVNACAAVASDGPPEKLLQNLHKVESVFGRERVQRWGSRTLDLDLLAMAEAVLPDPVTWQKWRDLPPEDQRVMAPKEMILPHPRLHERGFVLVPLRDIAPEWVHPVLRQNVAQICAELPADAIAGISPL